MCVCVCVCVFVYSYLNVSLSTYFDIALLARLKRILLTKTTLSLMDLFFFSNSPSAKTPQNKDTHSGRKVFYDWTKLGGGKISFHSSGPFFSASPLHRVAWHPL